MGLILAGSGAPMSCSQCRLQLPGDDASCMPPEGTYRYTAKTKKKQKRTALELKKRPKRHLMQNTVVSKIAKRHKASRPSLFSTIFLGCTVFIVMVPLTLHLNNKNDKIIYK
jgi:hypothetical protein